MNRAVSWPISLVSLALASCGGGGGTSAPPVSTTPTPAPVPTPAPAPAPTPASIEREIDPAATSAAITSNFAVNVAINPSAAVAAKGKLFVMLPGTGGVPRVYRLIVREGAARGYHTIGLTYPNDNAITDLCAGTSDPDCTAKARHEVITGEDLSPLVSVNPANSITGRLTVLLTYLNATYPAEGWGQFLSGGQPAWSKITIAGHSQGAGHAAYFAKLQNLDRVVMFSGPGDLGVGITLAPWYALANVTPVTRQYGFMHTADGSAPFALVTAAWARIGLDAQGPVTSVDMSSAPYGNSHQLSTSAEPNRNGFSLSPEHGAPVVDAATPLTAAGTPLYAPVWDYLAFP